MEIVTKMFEFRNIIWCSFICIIFLVSSSSAQDVCKKKSSCVCVFPNGTGIDLTPTVTNTFYTASYNRYEFNNTQTWLFTYYYHPCYDVAVPFNVSNNLQEKTCNGPLTMARRTHTFDQTNASTNTYTLRNETCELLAFSNKSDFAVDPSGLMSIVYSNDASNNVVLLFCLENGKENLAVYSAEEPNKIDLAFYSSHACLKEIEPPGRSLGSTLLIVFFCLVIFYLVLGVCTKKFLMGATGIEVIPNLGFWSDLPNLVRDGWAFAINGFKLPARSNQMSSPDPNSYDSI